MTRLELLTVLYSLETIQKSEVIGAEDKVRMTSEILEKVIKEAERS